MGMLGNEDQGGLAAVGTAVEQKIETQ